MQVKNSGVDMRRVLLGVACAFGLGGLPALAAQGVDGPIEGFGNDIPLSLAVKQIVPTGFIVGFGQGVNKDSKVSWRGGSDWRTVLDNMVRARNMTVSYSDSGVKIVDANAAFEGEPSSRVAAAASPLPAQRVGGLVLMPMSQPAPMAAVAPQPMSTPVAAPQPEPEARAAPLTAAARRTAQQAARNQQASLTPQPVFDGVTWRARQGQTLDQVLSDWAEKAGWTLVFSSKMIYELQASADFQGDFLSVASTLVRSIQANPRPIATFYRGNKVVVVGNTAETN